MIYLTHTRLMTESESTVHENAVHGDGAARQVCTQLIYDEPRYSLWFSRHDRRMFTVSVQRQRERQLLTLRALGIDQVHRAALVRYLRDYQVTGRAREQTLREFYGVLDPARSVLAEHRTYLLSASSQLCALDILDMTGDQRGADLIRRYQTSYGHFFSMFCDRARARQNGRPYLLSCLIPEVKANAEKLRKGILAGQLLPRKPVSISSSSIVRIA